MKDKLKNLAVRLKSDRKLQIGLSILVILILVCGYFLFLRAPKTEQSPPAEDDQIITSDSEAYAKAMEDKLEKLLSSIKGAGKVKVMISLESGFEYVYATETSVKETSSGQITTTEVVLVDGKPVITQTIYPKIGGVLVSSTGANDVAVKLRLISALQTVIDVANEDITILTGQ